MAFRDSCCTGSRRREAAVDKMHRRGGAKRNYEASLGLGRSRGVQHLPDPFGRPRAGHRKRYRLGHTYPATGFLSRMGIAMKSGLDAALAEANAAGGINGRRIRTISIDDAFVEEKFVANIEKLALEDQVLALVCPAGTAQLGRLRPFAEKVRIPDLGIISKGQLIY